MQCVKKKTKCNTNGAYIMCEKCNKNFYGKECYDSHLRNKKCVEHSYMCKKCHKLLKTKDLRPENHKCDEIKCGNCKKWVNMPDHKC